MIKYFQQLKRKRGFTLIELIVVVALIAVLIAALVPMTSGKGEKIKSANMHASDFYGGLQYIMTHIQKNEYPVTPAIALGEKNTTSPIIQELVKYEPSTSQNVLVYPYTYIYIEIKEGVFTVNAAKSFSEMVDTTKIADKTLFEQAIEEQLDEVLETDYSGYCYALVYNGGKECTNFATREFNKDKLSQGNIRVLTTHFMSDPLPVVSGDGATYINENLMFDAYGELVTGEVCGTCSSDIYTTTETRFVGDGGTYFLNVKDVSPSGTGWADYLGAIHD